eukprot:586045-Rhodomonas_salina.1
MQPHVALAASALCMHARVGPPQCLLGHSWTTLLHQCSRSVLSSSNPPTLGQLNSQPAPSSRCTQRVADLAHGPSLGLQRSEWRSSRLRVRTPTQDPRCSNTTWLRSQAERTRSRRGAEQTPSREQRLGERAQDAASRDEVAVRVLGEWRRLWCRQA